jgi:hypothetical protein
MAGRLAARARARSAALLIAVAAATQWHMGAALPAAPAPRPFLSLPLRQARINLATKVCKPSCCQLPSLWLRSRAFAGAAYRVLTQDRLVCAPLWQEVRPVGDPRRLGAAARRLQRVSVGVREMVTPYRAYMLDLEIGSPPQTSGHVLCRSPPPHPTIEFVVGAPEPTDRPDRFGVELDTGSAALAVPSAACANCAAGVQVPRAPSMRPPPRAHAARDSELSRVSGVPPCYSPPQRVAGRGGLARPGAGVRRGGVEHRRAAGLRQRALQQHELPRLPGVRTIECIEAAYSAEGLRAPVRWSFARLVFRTTRAARPAFSVARRGQRRARAARAASSTRRWSSRATARSRPRRRSPASRRLLAHLGQCTLPRAFNTHTEQGLTPGSCGRTAPLAGCAARRARRPSSTRRCGYSTAAAVAGRRASTGSSRGSSRRARRCHPAPQVKVHRADPKFAS